MYRSHNLAIALFALACVATAQAPNRCEVTRNNGPCFGTSLNAAPSTGRRYNHEVYQPAGYLGTPGVSVGDEVWRWVPRDVDQRLETRQISGYSAWLRPTASTPNASFPMTGYIPDLTVYAVQPRSGGVGMEPDLSVAPLLTAAGGSVPFFSPDAHRVTSSFGTAIPVDSSDMCMSLRFRGGERRDLAGGQGLVGTVDEAAWPVVTWGCLSASSSVVSVADPVGVTGGYTTPWMSWFEVDPVIIAHSNYASLRIDFCSGVRYWGFNDGAGQSDLVTQAVDIGWNVDAGSMWPGAVVLPLFNLGAALPTTGTAWAGTVIELDLANPLIASLASYGGSADPSGYFTGPRLPFAAVGTSLMGLRFGAEFLVFDAGLSTVVGSTQAHWIEIQ